MSATNWVVAIHYSEPFEMVSRLPAEALGLKVNGEAVTLGQPDYFIVADAKNLSKVRGRFKDPKRAHRKAEELNRFEVQGPLDPAFKARRSRLKRLAPGFGYLYSGPAEARWPVRPKRYLLDGFGWHGDEWHELVDTLDEVRDVLAGDLGHEVLRVIDLDTGEQLGFERNVTVVLP